MDEANRLKLLLDNAPGLIAFLDPDCRYQFASGSHAAWFGVEAASTVGLHARDVLGADAFAAMNPHFEQAMAGHQGTFVGEVQFVRGGRRFIHSTAIPRSKDGSPPAGLLVLVTDLTEHTLMERALNASHRRARAVLETAVDGIITIDEKGIVESFNHGAEIQFGYRAAEIIGQNIKILMPRAYADRHDEYLERYIDTGERHIIGIGREVTGRRKDGTEFPAYLSVGEFIEGDQHYYTGFIRDISERKAAELEARIRHNQLAHATRLNSLGELAASIAHEVNQPLAAIVSMAQALLRSLQTGPVEPGLLSDTLKKVVQQGQRAGTVVNEIRNFVRKERASDFVKYDLNLLLHDVLGLLTYELQQQNVRIRMALDRKALPVRIHRVQVEQVVLNLVQNAIQAMSDATGARVLTVRSQTRSDDPTCVRVDISDTGHGLPEGAEARVFEPFFTTKPDGMGQGLSISKSIIEAHGGEIVATRNHDCGATFTISLKLDADTDTDAGK